MRDEILSIRLEPELKKKIDILVKEDIETKSNIVREALMDYVKKRLEMKEIKRILSKKFAEDKISFEELVRLIGYEEAKKVAFYVETAKKSFEEGLK